MSYVNRLMALLCLCVMTLSACCNKKTEDSGLVIILNGSSAVGKTSIIKAFQAKQNTLWLGIGIDNFFVGLMPSKFYLEDTPEHRTVMHGVATEDAHGKLFTLHVGPQGYKVVKGMHKAIAAYARAGNNVIVDYIMYEPEWLIDLQQALTGINVVTVGVTASLATIEQREKKRATSPEGHARSLYDTVHRGWKYDLEINTDDIAPDQVADLIIEHIERTKTMNKPTKPKNSGQFLAKDKQGNSITLEWYKTNLVAPDFAAAMKDAWVFARDAYTPVEMEFLKAFPEVVGKEPYFKSFEQLFQGGFANVDWKAAEEIMQSILQGHFVYDPAKFPEQMKKMYENDQAFFVVAKDAKTGKGLGLITFMIRANYAVGDVKVMSFAVDVAHQKRGLGKLLMSSIFKIVPDIKRIFLCTRVTNDTALNAYSSWGFVKDEKPVLDHAFNLDHWTFMEYKTESSDALQKVAASLVE